MGDPERSIDDVVNFLPADCLLDIFLSKDFVEVEDSRSNTFPLLAGLCNLLEPRTATDWRVFSCIFGERLCCF